MNRSREQQNFRRNRDQRTSLDHGADNWAISYGDMITLLLAFFVLFFNIGATNTKVHFLEEELRKNFTYIDKDINRKPDSVSTWGSVTEGAEQLPNIMNRKLEKLPKIHTKIDGNRLLVEFPGVSFFKSAEYQLTYKGQRALGQFANTFKKYTGEYRLIVRGYTDNRPVKSGRVFKDNLELSSLRSVAAIRQLNKSGIPLVMMRIGGYGETDKSQEISKKDILKYDRKIVLVVEPLDKTERGIAEDTI